MSAHPGTEATKTGLVRLLAGRYGTKGTAVACRYDEGRKALYRAERSDGAWMVRLFGPQRPRERTVGDAVILGHLGVQGFPAERLIRATDGSSVTELDGRAVLVTAHVAGVPADRRPEVLERVGESMGRLHATDVAGHHLALSRRAGSLPAEEDAIRFRPLAVAVRSVCSTMERGQAEEALGWGARYAEAALVAERARVILSTSC